MADAGFEEVVFDRPFHEVVVDGGFGDFFVVFGRLVVVARDGGEVGDFEEELVR